MFKYLLSLFLILPMSAFEEKILFESKLTDDGESCTCHVYFNNVLPKPQDVDKIVRSALESAAIISPNKDIWASAARNDEAGTMLKETEYSGTLIYTSKDKRIITHAEYSGDKISNIDAINYFMQVVERKTLVGKNPKKYLTISVVFPKQPAIDQASKIAISEIEKRIAQGVDISLYLKVGDKNDKFSWQQVRNIDEPGYLWFSYNSSKRTINSGRRLIKVFP
jgi:hypothetical protein